MWGAIPPPPTPCFSGCELRFANREFLMTLDGRRGMITVRVWLANGSEMQAGESFTWKRTIGSAPAAGCVGRIFAGLGLHLRCPESGRAASVVRRIVLSRAGVDKGQRHCQRLWFRRGICRIERKRVRKMAVVKMYRVKLAPERNIKVAATEIRDYKTLCEVALTWYRTVRPVGESMIVVGVSGQNEVLGIVEVSKGGAHGAAVTPADIFSAAFCMGAHAIFLAHNHPSENPTPSLEDLHMTQVVSEAGQILRLPLLDHVTVAVRRGETRSCLAAIR